jgi:hypothetical protein
MDYKHIGIQQFASDSGCLTDGNQQIPALYSTMAKHPTEKVGTQAFAIEAERKELQSMSVMYGSHMAMRTVLDRSIASKSQRAVDSNNFGLNQHMGRVYEINFHDYLDNVKPEMDKEGIHSRMEKVYGM